jgi:hypothetical protein
MLSLQDVDTPRHGQVCSCGLTAVVVIADVPLCAGCADRGAPEWRVLLPDRGMPLPLSAGEIVFRDTGHPPIA